LSALSSSIFQVASETRCLFLIPVKLNPILTGHVYENNRSGREELRIQSGTFPVESHSFVQIIKPNQTINIDYDSLNATQLLRHITEEYFALLDESELTSEQIQKRLPLFSATLILLPDNHAIYSMKMSHAVGDGVTFFMLLKQLSFLMSELEVHPINWDHPQKSTHELYPSTTSRWDIGLLYGAPFMIGAAKNVLTQRDRQVTTLLLDKQKINSKKHELRRQLACDDVSSNDVITAALCRSNLSSDIFIFTENARGIIPGIGRDCAGNFLFEVPVTREVGSRPDLLRRVVASSQNQDYLRAPTDLPLKPFLSGRVGRITSIATIPANLIFDGTETLFMIPYFSFFKDIPLDTALIFRFNNQYCGVLHNFAEFETTGLMEELMPDENTPSLPLLSAVM
jgi:hypothetical protein